MLVVVMNVHQVTQLLTFNKGDFKRFADITTLTPTEVIQTLPATLPPAQAALPT
jgi:hypothetical protein